jgi:hypothetical protein
MWVNRSAGLRLDFDRRLILGFHGAAMTSEGELLTHRGPPALVGEMRRSPDREDGRVNTRGEPSFRSMQRDKQDEKAYCLTQEC